MGKDDLVKKLEEELKKAVPKSHPVIDRAVIIGYLARLTQKELDELLEEVKRLRNGVWKPLEETKKYKHKEPKMKKDSEHKDMGSKV